ncbi:formimidoylglutamate deiminase [Acuticoccus sp. I52.16.1]|uniref:formimidoylglutamate deiminase n=1 Tax=Acuticoccus sp. I52.16.1 TaxID=2928472 RepID=UPI001FD5FCE0|nr:formimidoylglutamate deiminase [Acuticoccus sp. I52.16.1]UOM35018.1 formimidoylglutamate deiminase [Acuticoccus sp. I52.16.1]
METIWAGDALLDDGWARGVALTLDGGRITAVERGVPETGRRVEVLLPAPTNLHSHAFQRAMAGLTEFRGPDPSDSFWTWRQLMFRFLDRLTPDHVEAIAAFVQMEMLEAGYGAGVEFHYLHHAPGGTPYANLGEMSARIAAAATTSGIGLTLLPVLYQQGGCDGRPLAPGQIRFGNAIDAFAALMEAAGTSVAALPPDARLGLAVHSLRAVAPDPMRQVLERFGDGPIHMHLAEQVPEVVEVEAALGARPVRWALDNLPLDPRWCLIHCTQMEPAETLGLAATGAVAGLCPITESNLGDGIFDGVRYLAAGGRIGVGSDSNIRIALAEELRTLEHSQRLKHRGRAMLAEPSRSTGRRLWEEVAAGGAQAAGRDCGRIAPGALADLVALDGSGVDLAGLSGDMRIDAFVFAAMDRCVADVWSAGRHMVTEGRHVRREAITTAYRRALTDLREAV